MQLGGALFMAVLLPAIAIRLPLRELSLDTYDQNVAGTFVAVMLTSYLWRNISLFPGITRGYFVLPSVLTAYAIVFSAFLFLRLDYSRGFLLSSMALCASWLYLTQMLAGRGRVLRFAVAPFGEVKALAEIRSIEWTWLKEPEDKPGSYDAIVADFRHDLSDAWEAFLADRALNGVPVFHVKDLAESLTGRVQIEHLSENSFGSLIPFMAYLRLRRIIDLVTAGVAIILLAVPLIVVGLLIRLDSPGPALFRQRRIGYRGKPFLVAKFRTMALRRGEPDERLHAMTKENDHRVTRLGRFLRRSRIDELPQILNILKGEMGWIGPRPEAEVLSRWYESELPFYRYRHIVPPGITGWAQVNQGHVADLEQVNFKLQYDFYYIKNFSPWLDALILVRTVWTMFSGFGSR